MTMVSVHQRRLQFLQQMDRWPFKYAKTLVRSYGNQAATTYNATYVVHYCTFGSNWIGYNDMEAIKTKVSYAKEKRLLGYNVFQASSDENWVLSLLQNQCFRVDRLKGGYFLMKESFGAHLVDPIRRNLDWAHVIAYGYYVSSKVNFTRPHAALYDPWSNVRTSFGIREWTRKGLPASKLVMGLPYHGFVWTLVKPNDNGLGAPAFGSGITADGSMSYKMIVSLIRDYGNAVATTYNGTYVVNHCTIGNIWIGYDDVEAIRTKVSYAKEKKLLRYHVFFVSNDKNWMVSRAAGNCFLPRPEEGSFSTVLDGRLSWIKSSDRAME
ncbi:hypothetical protein L1049_001479 [Liquidambar formosana]|uniref:GH18 domain-containing protein n=1 Tax=Liquidambar formosana TaxID=63359 RepID=A0AAP0R8C7_LIQFO